MLPFARCGRFWMVICAVILLAGGCMPWAQSTTSSPAAGSGTGTTRGNDATPAADFTPLGVPGCRPPSPARQEVHGPMEVRGTASGVELWALILGSFPVGAQQNVKIVWRMTGSGSFQLFARHIDGTRLESPLQPHTGSTWNRPGDEWGSAFNFPKPGCWQLHASRGTASGDVWLMVES